MEIELYSYSDTFCPQLGVYPTVKLIVCYYYDTPLSAVPKGVTISEEVRTTSYVRFHIKPILEIVLAEIKSI